MSKNRDLKPLNTVNSRGVLMFPHIAKAHTRVVLRWLINSMKWLPGQIGGRAGGHENAAQAWKGWSGLAH